jgi:hypothetical protein
MSGMTMPADCWQQASAVSQFYTEGYEERICGREVEESPLLEAVTRERLMTAGWEGLSAWCGDL